MGRRRRLHCAGKLGHVAAGVAVPGEMPGEQGRQEPAANAFRRLPIESLGCNKKIRPEAVDHGIDAERRGICVDVGIPTLLDQRRKEGHGLEVVSLLQFRHDALVERAGLGLRPEGEPDDHLLMGADRGMEVGLQHGLQAGGGRLAARLDGGHPERLILLRQLGQGCRQELVLALEVEVDDPRRKPCGASNMVKRRSRITMASDATDCGFNQLLLPCLLDQIGLAQLSPPNWRSFLTTH